MPVFISHRKADSRTAALVAERLRQHDIALYLDLLDGDLHTSESLTRVILERLGLCSHLIAVVSGQTRGSWWVPFEIGAASESSKRITTYAVSRVDLPEYLEIWPIMTRIEQVDLFARLYQTDKEVLLEQRSNKAYTTSIRTARDFHTMLKSQLGQR